MEGWVKLWRKSLNSELRRNDPTAWRIFETLLLIVDKDTGQWSGGRFQLAELDGSIRSVTLYKALKRLEKCKMVTLSSNNKFTTISICNWSSYQSNGNTKREQQSNNKVTTTVTLLQEGNRELRIKNKEIYKEKLNVTFTVDQLTAWGTKFNYLSSEEIVEEIEAARDYLKANGQTKKDYHAYVANWLRRTNKARRERYGNNQASQTIRNGTAAGNEWKKTL